MGLAMRQMVFAGNFAKLVARIYNTPGHSCTIGEVWRTPEMAKLYAERGIGIIGSQHCKKLACDINLFIDGVFQEDGQAHKPFGDYWELLNPDNRWGGDWDGDDVVDPGDDDGNHYEMKW
jgi:hypothetical protein